MAKQKEDEFTKDAFSAPRRGRPRKTDTKSNAQRQREFRARKKSGFADPVKQASSHATELRSLASRLLSMSADWGEVDEYFRAELERLSNSAAELEKQVLEFVSSDGVLH